MGTRNKEPLNWGGRQEMTELESAMWRANRHPENSTQGGVLEILGATPDWEDVRRFHEYGLSEYPRFVQKVVEPALPVGPPVWVDDPGFDLDHHLRRVQLPSPGSHEQLLQEAGRWALKPLDPRRPPWLSVFIEGLEGGRSAYFLVVHHCLMDGHGSVQLLSDLHTRPKSLAEAFEPTGKDGVEVPGRWNVAMGQVVSRAQKAPTLTARALGAAVKAAKAPDQAAAFAASVARVLAPPPASTSELLGSGSRTNWAYGTMSCELADLRAAAKSVGGTINDAYVCAILGGLRIYHEEAGMAVGDVTINMPVSMRREGDLKGGNRFAAAFMSAPASVVDPVERMKALRATIHKISSEPALDFFSLVLPLLNRAQARLLTPLFTGMQNRTDVTISNVPGMRDQASLLGAPVEGIYYFGPLPGSPVMVVLHSHGGKAFIGVNCDGDVFDRTALMDCLQRGFNEILELRHQTGAPTHEEDQPS